MLQMLGRGVRRGREGVAEGRPGKASASPEAARAGKRQAGDVLAGLTSEGPAWRLKVGGSGGGGEEHCLQACLGMLEQALGCSELADVRFVFDDGLSEVGGHRGLLSSVSEVFAGMFRAGMEESETGRVRVRGVSRESFRVFLEYVYVGRVGGGVGLADGRELWVLAEAYQVCGLREWLLREGVWGMDSACSAMQYAKSAEGRLEELVGACEDWACSQLGGATEAGLRGVGVEAASALLATHCGNKRLWRGCDVYEGFQFAERWVRANGGAEGVGGGCVERLVGQLELGKLPLDVLTRVVRPSGLVSCERLYDLSTVMHEQLRRDLLPGGLTFVEAESVGSNVHYCVAVDEGGGEGGGEQLLAASDISGKCVRVFRVHGGEEVRTIGPDVEGLGKLGGPTGVAFNGRGELLVSDYAAHRIHVFGRDGGYLRSIGREGGGEGELNCPGHLAVSPEGHILVSEEGNGRVQVLREDGSFVREIGAWETGGAHLGLPCGVALGPDGSVVVVDYGCARVQVFDQGGAFVRSIGGEGDGAGEFVEPIGVCILPGGQILVSDRERDDVQVFSWEGVYLRSVGGGGDSRVELGQPVGLAVDARGRVFVACIGAQRVHVLARADS